MSKSNSLLHHLKRSFVQLFLEIQKLPFKIFRLIISLYKKSLNTTEKSRIFPKNNSRKSPKNHLGDPRFFNNNYTQHNLRTKKSFTAADYRRNKNWFTSIWLRKQFQRPLSSKGFVLPTMTMVLLIFSLVVGSILWRTSQYNKDVIFERQAQVIYNTATPAVERGKTKLEFLFKRDYRFPNSIPSVATLQTFMLNESTSKTPYKSNNGSGAYLDIYTLPGENRIDINGDGTVDNAWSYETDVDGDGKKELVAYSILMAHQSPVEPATGQTASITLDSKDADKAKKLVTRTGPLTIQNNSVSGVCGNTEGLRQLDGWYMINNASVRKNFQIDAVVINKDATNKAISTLEMQQDRQLDRGNKWGVWFRYDLEVFPGPPFNWNGAMYTGGNLIWGQNDNKPQFHNYLISAPSSCFYTEDASEIVMAQVEDEKGKILFQGQAIAGASKPKSGTKDYYQGISRIDIYPGSKTAPSEGPPDTNEVVLSKAKQSLTIDNKSYDGLGDSLDDQYEDATVDEAPLNYALDPIVLFTEDKSQSRNPADTTNAKFRDPNWPEKALAKRIINKLVNKPYVDDAYRADNRWGPKPTYTTLISVPKGKNGLDIDEYTDVLTQNDPPQNLPDNVGLDGYWERRARVEGLRVIVGQRLELGNNFDWKGNDDPLYPPNSTITNLDRQRKTLRDNLAAVQSTVIYHYENESNGTVDKDFPIATLATTVHNSTINVRDKSTTFTTDSSTLLPNNINFLSGEATNGWEFIPPGGSTTGFKALIDQTTDPLRIALNNLAHFAGDPDGAFPPKQETSGSIVHPYPNLTMWGDFSNLRRVMDLLDAGTTYDNLSIADKTTLHTAASDLGLLAYNLKNSYHESAMDGSNNPGITALGNQMWQVISGPSKDWIENLITLDPIPDNLSPAKAPFLYNDLNLDGDGKDKDGELNPITHTLTRPTDTAYYGQFFYQFTSDQFIEAFMKSNGLGSTKDEKVVMAKQVITVLQFERDRELGFAGSTGVWAKSKYDKWDLPCDISIFDDVVNGGGGGLDDKKAGLALAFCPKLSKPRYPALYYLFPTSNHDQVGKLFGVDNTYGTGDDQPATEEYIADKYIFDATTSPIQGINFDYTYNILTDSDSNGEEDLTELTTWLTQVALTPRKMTEWKLPSSTTDTGTGNKITVNTVPVYTAFLDKAFYDGRQLMQVRTIDVDLNLLRKAAVKSDRWLTSKGIIYAFREDAVREDGIARPASDVWNKCDTEAELNSTACVMNVNTPKDPPINADTGVSTKPVDFYPDPDRRPYGFRLKNGSELKRDNTKAGISFISDNPIYIHGDFNLHKNSSGTRLEEFTDLLKDDWSNYYTRTTLNSNFAFPETDYWRPTEILGDAVTILSNEFCDGTFEDGMENKNVTGSCPTNINSSYLDSVLSKQDPNTITTEDQWRRENSTTEASNNLDYPITVDRNAKIYGSTNTEFNSSNYRKITDGRTLNTASETNVNAILINALVPSRRNQPYGGFHNFPRFLQNWGGKNLRIAGAFFQLNFSTYATAPFDQEDEEIWNGTNLTKALSDGESIPYYSPPNRRWGYDVALQYVPASPIASRFINVGSPRSEFYEQKSAEDPYIMWLRCAYKDSTKTRRIDPHVTAAQCSAL